MHNSFKFMIIILGALCIAGCNKSSDQQTATQVVAKVNGKEISVYQVNQILKSIPNLNQQAIPAIRKEILDKLIDQQIAIEQAGIEKIDRNPDVVIAIDAAKRQVIANAYISYLASSIKISDDDIKSYYDENPALFSQRKIYSFEDVAIDQSEKTKLAIEDGVTKFNNSQEFITFIKSKVGSYSGGFIVKPSEQIPLDVLLKFQKFNSGDVLLVDSGNVSHAIYISNVQIAPVKLEDVKNQIRTYLTNVRAKEIIGNKFKVLKEKAKIEYLGEFSDQSKEDKQSVMNKGLTGF